METWGERLRAEREKAGLSQRKIAEISGISPPTQVNYEKGGGNPPGDYWLALHQAGLDIHFILTGERTTARLPIAVGKVTPQQLEDTLEMVLEHAQRAKEMIGALFKR